MWTVVEQSHGSDQAANARASLNEGSAAEELVTRRTPQRIPTACRIKNCGCEPSNSRVTPKASQRGSSVCAPHGITPARPLENAAESMTPAAASSCVARGAVAASGGSINPIPWRWFRSSWRQNALAAGILHGGMWSGRICLLGFRFTAISRSAYNEPSSWRSMHPASRASDFKSTRRAVRPPTA